MVAAKERHLIVKKIGMIGSGSWATALVKILLEQADQMVNWWVRSDEARRTLAEEGRNAKHLTELRLDAARINASGDLREVVEQSDCIFLAIPSAYIGDTLDMLPREAYKGKRFVSAIKGVLPRRRMPVSMFLERNMGVSADDVCVVSGPSHAEEVAEGMPTFLTVASRNEELTKEVEAMLKCSYIHTSRTRDIDGVERLGLGKNIYAIAAGMCSGLGYGDNLTAVLTVAAFRELKRLFGMRLPFENRDMDEPCYLGDLMVTCWSKHSRNRRLGELVAQGKSVEEACKELGTVAEGYYSVKNMHGLCKELKLEMPPIAEMVYRVLYEGSDPRKEIEYLVNNVF